MRNIWVTFSQEGVHYYPGADTNPATATGDWDDVSFLGYKHRHIFPVSYTHLTLPTILLV